MQANPYGIAALWQQGDLVIKAIAMVLLIMSIATWCVLVLRGFGLWRSRRAYRAVGQFWQAQSFDEGLSILARNPSSPFLYLAQEGQRAVARYSQQRPDPQAPLSLADWLTASLRGAIDECAARLQSGLAILASVASVAPFVGLFGTVWGIYHALVSIGVSGQASIDKVAGPVGEALVMTAFGLGVAIPAALGYNALNRANKGVLGQINRFALQLYGHFLLDASPAASAEHNTPASARKLKEVG